MADLYLDNDVSLKVAPFVRRAGHGVTTTRDLGFFRASDEAQLLTAVRNGWVLVTYNRRDFTMVHDAWRTWPTAFGLALPPHPGILVLDPGPPALLAGIVNTLLAEGPVDRLANELLWWHHRVGWHRWTGDAWQSQSNTTL